jgi:hypothetical protein
MLALRTQRGVLVCRCVGVAPFPNLKHSQNFKILHLRKKIMFQDVIRERTVALNFSSKLVEAVPKSHKREESRTKFFSRCGRIHLYVVRGLCFASYCNDHSYEDKTAPGPGMLSPFGLRVILTALLYSSQAVFIPSTSEEMCPCKPSLDTYPEKPQKDQTHLLCVADTDAARIFFANLSPKALNLNYRLLEDELDDDGGGGRVSGNRNVYGCDVLVKVVVRSQVTVSKNQHCPGVCRAIPFVVIPSYFLTSVLNSESTFLTMCSVNVTTSYNGGTIYDVNRSLGLVLRTIAIRRLQECEENKDPLLGNWDYIPLNPNDISDPFRGPALQRFTQDLLTLQEERRKVYGVVIWIGSNSRIRMVHDQFEVLRLQEKGIGDSKRIVGWAATEEVYSCSPGGKRCTPATRTGVYKFNMPRTVNHKSTTSLGWVCAQRRPLRAMAHVLRLYDPDFLLVVDDDSFVNIKLLAYGTVLSSYILQTMSTQKIVLGDMRDETITIRGFYFGGGGYLMGRSVLQSLQSTFIESKSEEVDDKRWRRRGLGVLTEAYDLSSKQGDGCASCVIIRPPANDSTSRNLQPTIQADLSVRTIDLCVNMMAERGSCYHSDHSITRCLVYAIYADTMTAGCNGIHISSSNGSQALISMCYDATDCDLSKALICHRHVANRLDLLEPPRLLPFVKVY